MKRPVLLMALVILTVLSAPSLFAAEPASLDPLQPIGWLEEAPPFISQHAFLASVDNEREIRLLTAACVTEVDHLLSRIAEASTEEEIGALIRSIHRAETRRDVAILSIFIRNAEASGQYGLALEMRNEVVKMQKYGLTLEVAVAP